MHFKTIYTEETLLESMWSLKRAIRRVEGVFALEKARETGIGIYEGEIERERKWNTKLHIKRSL